ncbi:Rft-1 protein [Rhizoctonia solani]|uniref:Man(5)GlcNAc(2)-PP-dolichol translocation protein RFT1 n=1 Tax=Rhizoctonia solani TaxID=456999 RepID=A0A8H7M8R4_9AGAM|nr:Rft-1 protein [Rhizoctonia solani]
MMTTTKPKTRPDDDPAKGSVKSAYSLIGLQVLSRLATFTLNQLLLRLASPKSSAQPRSSSTFCYLLFFFFPVKVFEMRFLEYPENNQSRRNSRLPHNCFSSTRAQPYFDQAVSIYALAALIDLVSEPLHNRAQSLMRFNLRVKAEGTAIVSRSVCTVVALMAAGEHWSLVAFATGQLAYAVTVLLVYTIAFWKEGGFQIFPRRVHENGVSAVAFDPTSSKLALTMTGQSVFKHFLTEGDRIVISRVSPLEDQGGYAVASNYGPCLHLETLALDRPFHRLACGAYPIPANRRVQSTFFSKTLSPPLHEKGSKTIKPSKEAQFQASTTLQSIVFLHFHLAIALTTLLGPLVPFLSDILLPPDTVRRLHRAFFELTVLIFPQWG